MSPLPTCGTYAPHSERPSVCLYYTPYEEVVKEPKKNLYRYKYTGLWISKDNQQNWKRLGNFPNIAEAMIHPVTDMLFAVVLLEELDAGANGFVSFSIINKIVMSRFGERWVEITPNVELPKAGDDSCVLFPDPDNPGRICVFSNPLTNIYQSLDDDYSEWKKYTHDEWENLHTDWMPHTVYQCNWNKAFWKQIPWCFPIGEEVLSSNALERIEKEMDEGE